MNIKDLLFEENIILNANVESKEDIFTLLSQHLEQHDYIDKNSANQFQDLLKIREQESTTGVGNGIAIPHAKGKMVKQPLIAILKPYKPLNYESLDENPVEIVFLIAVPEQSSDEHLNILATLSRNLMDDSFLNKLLKADTKKEILELMEMRDLTKDLDSKEQQNNEKNYFFVAVTACPTGIAHTYMAAENLEKASKEKNILMKVETNGSTGVENALTVDDIQKADAVIIAADTKVETSRFQGKKMIETSVSKAINNPRSLMEEAMSAPVFTSEGAKPNRTAEGQDVNRKKPRIYASLMNGVSNMLPLVVAGGILIAISFFWGINSADPEDPSYNAIAAMINEIGSGAFNLFIPVLAGFIALAIADRPGLAPGLVGGYLAFQGGSGFLGAIVAGFAAGYLILGLKKVFSTLPKSLEGLKPILLYPLISVFLVGLLTVGVLNPIMGEVNTAISSFLDSLGTSNRIILGFILGVMMASDLGGPINKAAYLFSLGALANGNFLIMGAVLTSGMVPSLATAVAAQISKKKFTKAQQEGAKANYVLGLSFIAEGAIPFAASNPFVILPSLMVGSGVTGALSMIFNVTSPAPHGGIFVLPIIGNPILFFVSIIMGVLVSTILILSFKKNVTEQDL